MSSEGFIGSLKILHDEIAFSTIFSVGSDRLGLPLSVEEVLKATSSWSYLCLVGYNSGFPHCCRHCEMIKDAKDNKWHDFHTFSSQVSYSMPVSAIHAQILLRTLS